MRYFCFFLILLIPSFESKGCELVVRFESYSDYSPQDNKDRNYGIDVHYAKALLEEAGCRYRFVDTPWARAVEMLKKGKIDMMLSMSYTPERAAHIDFVGPQRNETLVVATLRGFDEKLEKIEDIKHLTKPIAVQEGALYGNEFYEYYNKYTSDFRNIIDVPNNHIKLSLLRKGRIVGFVEEKYNVMFQVKNNPAFEGIVIQPLIINSTPVYIGLSKESVPKHLRDMLKRTFDKLVNEGAFNDKMDELEF